MKITLNFRTLSFALPLIILGLYGACAAEAAADGSLTLTILETNGTRQTDAASASYDFGEFSLLDHPKLKHTFTLRNNNSVPVRISRAHPTCGCTNVRFDVHGRGRKAPVMKNSGYQIFPITVPAGADVDVQAEIDSSHLDDLTFIKSVLITLAGQDSPSLTLNLTGDVHPALLMEPADVDFGDVHTGNASSLIITLNIDPKLLSGRRNLKVTCSVPEIAVSQPIDQQMASGYVARHYKLTLGKHMRMESFYGQLIVTPSAAGTKQAALRPHNGFIRGKIFGDFTASPDYISFGSPLKGSSPKQTVTITGTSPAAVRGLTVHSKNPWIIARANTPNPQNPAVKVIQLSLSPGAPEGGIQSQVIVRVSNGAEMALPVQAFVRAAR